MADGKTYLEFSDGGRSHKFYEVEVRGSMVHLRWGRIGEPGNIDKVEHHTPERARAFADKRIKEKEKKGYVERADQGEWQRRSFQRRDD